MSYKKKISYMYIRKFEGCDIFFAFQNLEKILELETS